MKKLSILFGMLLVLGMTVPALADVFVYADIDKYKEIYVYEEVNIYKNIDITVTVDDILERVAEADAVINQNNVFNWACENCAEKVSLINNSILGNIGVVNVNQATGNMNNQGNVVSVAIDVWPPDQPPPNGEPPSAESGLAHAQTSAEQFMAFNTINSINILYRNALIINSINGNIGIVGVNQSAGNINNQLNAVTIAVSIDGVVALAEADLGQFNTGFWCYGDNNNEDGFTYFPQSVTENNTNKNALISGSVNGNIGVVGVNQTVGNMANQANIANVAASIR